MKIRIFKAVLALFLGLVTSITILSCGGGGGEELPMPGPAAQVEFLMPVLAVLAVPGVPGAGAALSRRRNLAPSVTWTNWA